MVTIKEIANAVGVSSATVSRVLNYDMTLSISGKKRQTIIETAESLNYATPRNRNRSSDATSVVPSGGKIALVHFLRPTEELTDPYYIGVRLGIENRCQAHKLEVVKVYHSDDLPDANVLQNSSGVIVVGQHSDDEIAWLQRHSKHLVFADFCPKSVPIDSVESDFEAAMDRLLTSLLALSGVCRP